MSKRTKVPRASLACTILDDPDYIGLMQTVDGRAAFALFCALLAAAKAQGNNGQFKHPPAVIAAMVRWPVGDFNPALVTLNTETNWVLCDASLVIIRSFKKWNSWGGERNQAGRKSAIKMDSSAPQDARKDDSTGRVPVSVTDSVPEVTTTTTAALPPRPDPLFEEWWATYPKVLKDSKAKCRKLWTRFGQDLRVLAVEGGKVFAGIVATAPPDRQQYFKRASTWLSQQCWETPVEALQATARGSNGKPVDRKVQQEFVGDDSRY